MDKKRYAVLEKYASSFVQVVIEQHKEKEAFVLLSQIKDVCDEVGLADFLKNISVSQEEKAKSLRLFCPSGLDLVNHFIELVILNQREEFFCEMVEESLTRLEKATNQFEVLLKSAHPLSLEQKERLCPLLSKKMGLEVRSFKEELDESLIGGFVATANHKTIDASIKRQLQTVKENLK